jgi:hypothetical protein
MVADPRWPWAAAEIAAAARGGLAAHGDELLTLFLEPSSACHEAAFEVLRLLKLPTSCEHRLRDCALHSLNPAQVARALDLLALNPWVARLPRPMVERAMGLGGPARLAAIGAIAAVADRPVRRRRWLKRLLGGAAHPEGLMVLSAAAKESPAFLRSMLRRAVAHGPAALAADCLYRATILQLGVPLARRLVRIALRRWPTDRAVLLASLHAIKHARLRDRAQHVKRLLKHEDPVLASEAAFVMEALWPGWNR